MREGPSPRHARWWLVMPEARLSPDQVRFVRALTGASDPIRTAQTLAVEFGRLVRAHDIAAPEPWMVQAAGSALAEFCEFAAGLRRDFAAVRAAVELSWSNGQTEGQVNKLKVLAKYLKADTLGAMRVPDVKPKHVAGFLERLAKWPSPRGGTIAPRTVRNVYDALRRSFDHAVLHELSTANPCAPLHKHLPEIEDKTPGARDTWFFPRAEVWALMTDDRIPADRRIACAIDFLTGCRPGELSVLRWRDWDRSARSLTRLTLTRALKSVSRKEGHTKTGARKYVPVLPHLERVLTQWFTVGWRLMLGRDPGPDDLIAPNTVGNRRTINQMNRDFGRDLAKLGLRARHHYCTRHTFITQTQEDGGEREILKWATHAPPKSSYDGYTRAQWSRLCAEVGKLRVGPEAQPEGGGEGGGSLTPDKTPKNSADPTKPLESPSENESGREDLKRRGRVAHRHETLRIERFPAKDADSA